jgi:nucleotide-binding universal stress UspA family protein
MKKILVPTDFSANAFNALIYALNLAEHQSASVELLHVFHPPVVDISTSAEVLPELIEISEKQAIQSFEELKARLLEDGIASLNSLAVTYTHKMGFLVDIINQLNQKNSYDLIVMGTKGASGLKEVFLGSNTSQVIHKVKSPVMAIPEKALFHPIQNIAYATDLVLGDSLALNQLISFAVSLKATIRCFHIHNSKLQVEAGILDEM